MPCGSRARKASTRCTHRQRLHCRVDLAHVTLPRACQNGACTPMLALVIKRLSRSNHAYTRRGRFCGVWQSGALQFNTCCSCCRPCCCCCCCCCHQERKVLRVVCRWDLGAQLVKELLDDLKVKCLVCRRALGVTLRGFRRISRKGQAGKVYWRVWCAAGTWGPTGQGAAG